MTILNILTCTIFFIINLRKLFHLIFHSNIFNSLLLIERSSLRGIERQWEQMKWNILKHQFSDDMKHGLQRKSNFTWQERKKTAFEIINNKKKNQKQKTCTISSQKTSWYPEYWNVGCSAFLYFKNIFKKLNFVFLTLN
jgi:hypothetical protein